jgi:hypothetical protein
LERRPVTDYERCSWGVAPGVDFVKLHFSWKVFSDDFFPRSLCM